MPSPCPSMAARRPQSIGRGQGPNKSCHRLPHLTCSKNWANSSEQTTLSQENSPSWRYALWWIRLSQVARQYYKLSIHEGLLASNGKGMYVTGDGCRCGGKGVSTQQLSHWLKMKRCVAKEVSHAPCYGSLNTEQTIHLLIQQNIEDRLNGRYDTPFNAGISCVYPNSCNL